MGFYMKVTSNKKETLHLPYKLLSEKDELKLYEIVN